MGEAKRKQEAVRAAFIKEVEQWSFQPSEWEARMVEEVTKLPVVTVSRLPIADLEMRGMRAGKCHENARRVEEIGTAGEKRCVGWWILEGHYVLHSVVHVAGKYFCVTPTPLHPQDSFLFIPDSEIDEDVENGRVDCFRKGHQIGAGLRTDPQETLRICCETRRRLEAGGDPYRAI